MNRLMLAISVVCMLLGVVCFLATKGNETAILTASASANTNSHLYYPGRYFIVRNLEGNAVIIDLQETTSREVMLWGTNRPLTLAEKDWTSNYNAQ
jgi:hypothetical protein